MKLPAGFEELDDQITIRLRGARAVFTTRRGGFSTGPYESLNLGALTDDAPENVTRNRAELDRRTGVATRFARQVHGTDVIRLQSTEAPASPVEADGQATVLRGIAPAALVADCLPIAIGSDDAVAVVHAGWRGLAGGVIEHGVEAVRELGGRGTLAAAVGPGAGPCCYEVGEEVHAVFASRFPDARHGDNLDLKSIARSALEQAGVELVHDVGLCTICSDLFFSHRRDHGVTGRQAGIAWLN